MKEIKRNRLRGWFTKRKQSRKLTLLGMIFLARSRGCLCRKTCKSHQSCPETAIEMLRRSKEISYSCNRKVQFEIEHSSRYLLAQIFLCCKREAKSYASSKLYDSKWYKLFWNIYNFYKEHLEKSLISSNKIALAILIFCIWFIVYNYFK